MTAEGRAPVVLLPAGLRERVLAASRQARAAGHPTPPAAEISPDEAFSRAADAFHGMLRELPDAACVEATWSASTQAAAVRQAGRRPAQTRAEWRLAADRTMELARAGDLGAEVAVHGLRIPVSLLLIVRAFELWVHDNDIRQAAGLPSSVPDPATLSLMTELAARLLPAAAARTGVDEPMSLHLVLTGPGGGTWDVPIGTGGTGGADRAEPVDVVIVSDAVDFCRLVANRATPAGLDLHITGDAGRAAAVLAAAPALALD